jgi:tRNA-modifying protein YgfZ
VSGTLDSDLDGDYRALRDGAGVHRLGRDVLVARGPEARAFLQGQCTQDLDALRVGEVKDTLVLEPTGKLVALVRVLCLDDDTFVLETDAGFGSAVADRLARFRLRTKVEIEAMSWHVVAVRGLSAAAALADPDCAPDFSSTGAIPAGDDWMVPVSVNGTVGFDLLGPSAPRLVSDEARWCGDGAWEALRVEAGLPLMGHELDASTLPAESGLLSRAVSFTKGCYTGQELVARMDARGNRAPRTIAGLVPGDPALDGTALVGAELAADPEGKALGECTSAARCPGLGTTAALVRAHRTLAVPGPVWIRPVDGRAVQGTLATLPLVAGVS